MTRGVIDLGTNTVLMVVGSKEEGGKISVLTDCHRVGRLGKGVDETGIILPETFDRIGRILEEYREIGLDHGAEIIEGFGTSALRDAENRDEFIGAMREQSGIQLNLLSGADEARLTWSGALFGLPVRDGETGVIDIGGGSTEVARGNVNCFIEGVSVDTGAVRVTERFFRGGLPPSDDAIAEAREHCRSLFGQISPLPSGSTVVGVAGTVTTLGAIHNDIEQFDAEEINGTLLTREWVGKQLEALSGLSLDALREIPQIARGREDIITGGVLVLETFMEIFGVEEIIVSTRGLRYGLLNELLSSGSPL